MAVPKIPDGNPMSATTIFRRRKAAGLVKPQFQYPFNESFFNNWSDQLAWLTGIIWTDGCIYHNSIEICSADWQLIHLIAETIGMPDGIRTKNKGQHVRIVFTSKKVANWFRSIGLTERKSLTIGWPRIPKEYAADFMRGVLDGDGCVQVRDNRPGQQVPDINISFYTASIKFRDEINEWLDENHIKHIVRVSHHNVWVLRVVQQQAIRALFYILYPTDMIHCLHRKYSNYWHWINTPRARSGRPAK